MSAVLATDFDKVFIKDLQSSADPHWPLKGRVHDMLSGPVDGRFDGASCLDVLQHIPQESEDIFVTNLVGSLDAVATAVVGMPSLKSQVYASPQSREGPVNCKSGKDLVFLLERFFHYVFPFSMNDEVVHTGFSPMAHYLIAVCSHPKA